MVDTRDSFDINLIVGDDFVKSFVFFEDDDTTPADLTGWSAISQIRNKYDNDLIIDLTTNFIDNKFYLSLTDTQTETLRDLFEGERAITHVYDVQFDIPESANVSPVHTDFIASFKRNDAKINIDVSQ